MSETATAPTADGIDVGHRRAVRESVFHADGTWSGALSCHCGWHVRTESQRSREAVGRALQRAWTYHVGAPAG